MAPGYQFHLDLVLKDVSLFYDVAARRTDADWPLLKQIFADGIEQFGRVNSRQTSSESNSRMGWM